MKFMGNKSSKSGETICAKTCIGQCASQPELCAGCVACAAAAALVDGAPSATVKMLQQKSFWEYYEKRAQAQARAQAPHPPGWGAQN